jgi:hypothetical protein
MDQHLFSKLDLDSHPFKKLDPDPDPHKVQTLAVPVWQIISSVAKPLHAIATWSASFRVFLLVVFCGLP